MGILSSIGKMAKSFVSSVPIVGPALDLGFDYLSNQLIGKPNADDAFKQSQAASAQAFERSYGAYKNRYQDTMADMQKAGLNPILAAGSGGFNVGSAPQMQPATAFLPQPPKQNASSAFESFQKAKTEPIKRLKTLAETKESLQKAATERAKRGLMKEKERHTVVQIGKTLAETGRIFSEVKKIGVESDLGKAQIRKLKVQVKMLLQQFKQLKQTSDWYDGAYGDLLGWLRATLGSFGTILGSLPQMIK